MISRSVARQKLLRQVGVVQLSGIVLGIIINSAEVSAWICQKNKTRWVYSSEGACKVLSESAIKTADCKNAASTIAAGKIYRQDKYQLMYCVRHRTYIVECDDIIPSGRTPNQIKKSGTTKSSLVRVFGHDCLDKAASRV